MHVRVRFTFDSSVAIAPSSFGAYNKRVSGYGASNLRQILASLGLRISTWTLYDIIQGIDWEAPAPGVRYKAYVIDNQRVPGIST